MAVPQIVREFVGGAWRTREEVAAGGGSQPFMPTGLTGLALWLDASDASTINAGSPSDDDPVSAWVDKSGKGYDAAQAVTDGQPVYKIAVQNGKAAVRFDQTAFNQQMGFDGDALGMFNAKDGATVAAVWRNGVLSALFCASSGQDTSNKRVQVNGTGLGAFDFRSGNDDTNDLGDEASIAQVFSSLDEFAMAAVGWVDYSQGPSAGAVRSCAVIKLVLPDIGSSLAPFPATDSVGISLGGTVDLLVNDPPEGGIGDLCEIVVYDRALTTGERRQLLEYLADKWATL